MWERMSVFFSLSSLPLYKHVMERQRKTLPKYTLRVFRKINKSTPDKFRAKQDLMAQRTSVLFLNTAYPVTSITHTYIHTHTNICFVLGNRSGLNVLWRDECAKNSTKPHIYEISQHISEVLILEQFMSLLLKSIMLIGEPLILHIS